MGFSKGRKRNHTKNAPIQPKRDKGTTQLRAKRQQDKTTEALDLCHKRGLINESQHQAGLRFRWLYRLRNGSASLTAYCPDALMFENYSPYKQDEAWLGKRQQEYLESVGILKSCGAFKMVLNICVHHQRPYFLCPEKLSISPTSKQRQHKSVLELQHGLTGLHRFFTKKEGMTPD